MQFNKHFNLRGLHAPFSPSQAAWLRYDDERALTRYNNRHRTQLGTELHEFAKSQIDICHRIPSSTSTKQIMQNVETYIYSKYNALKNLPYGMSLISGLNRLPKEVFETLRLYINDAIGFKMDAEVVLYYSDYFFGTADAISYRDDILRVHDLKTGDKDVSMDQLLVYVALFLLEYPEIKLSEIKEIELRIYQRGEYIYYNPPVDEILPIKDKIIHFTKMLEATDKEV